MEFLLISKVERLFREHLGERYQDYSYLLALSGGSDSMALFTILKKLLPRKSLKVLYVDHSLRKNSREEAKKLRNLVTTQKIDFYSIRLHPQKKDENTLRELRWEALKKKQVALSCDYILTAHHLEDQLETFLQRLIRGTSVFGLSGMKPIEEKIFRPLLTFSKEDLLTFLKQENVSFFVDETNQDTQYFRNQIRLELLPQLYKVASRYGGKQSFLNRFDVLRKEIEVWDREEKLSLQKYLKKNLIITPYWGVIEKKILLKKKGQKRILLLKSLLKSLSISLEQKHLITLNQALKKNNFQLELPEGLRVRESFGKVYFQNKQQQKFLKSLKIGSFDIHLIKPISLKEELRFFKAGDSFKGKKMKHWFQELEIPFLKRSVLPVLAKKNSSEVSWFLGLPSASLKVMKNPLENSII